VKTKRAALFDGALAADLVDDTGHILIAGKSGMGKTQLMVGVALAKLGNPRWGVQVVDPEGEISAICLDHSANPRNGLMWRSIHYFRATSVTDAFAIPLLHVRVRAPQPCHEAAVRTRSVLEQAVNFGSGEYGPRLSKLLHLGCYGLALTGRPLIDLPHLYTLGAAHLRSLVGDAFPYEFMTEEWRSLDVLAERNATRFLEYCESITSRLMPIFGNERLRRIFGPQPPIDVAQILQNREAAFLDLAGLEHKDAVLVGTAYISVLYHEALQRPPNQSPHACVMVDEVFDYMTPDLARGFDRLRKRNIQLCVAIQRLSQLS